MCNLKRTDKSDMWTQNKRSGINSTHQNSGKKCSGVKINMLSHNITLQVTQQQPLDIWIIPASTENTVVSRWYFRQHNPTGTSCRRCTDATATARLDRKDLVNIAERLSRQSKETVAKRCQQKPELNTKKTTFMTFNNTTVTSPNKIPLTHQLHYSQYVFM